VTYQWLPSGASAGFERIGDSTDEVDVGFARHVPPAGDTFLKVTVWACSDRSATTIAAVADYGGSCQLTPTAPPCFAHPISVASGNMRMTDSDPLPSMPGLPLTRTYDSRNNVAGRFGMGWQSFLDVVAKTVSADGDTYVVIRTGDGESYVFRNFVQLWPQNGMPATLAYDGTAGTYTLHEPQRDVDVVVRASDGVPLKYHSRSTGRDVLIGYSGSVPVGVADSWNNWSWTLTANGNRISAVTVDGTANTWQYTYDTTGLLTTVQGPNNAAWRTYAYSSGYLTEARDAANRLIESHTYDVGQARSSISDEGDVTSVNYSESAGVTQARVTYATGAVTSFFSAYIGGRPRTTSIVGSCSGCGVNDGVYAYDTRGNMVREQDARGYITTRSFDAQGRTTSTAAGYKPSGCDPETDVNHCRLTSDALASAALEATSSTVTTTSSYGDTNWPDRPTTVTTQSVANPQQSRTTAYTYDATTGVVLREQLNGWKSATEAETMISTTALYDGTAGAAFNPGGNFDSAWPSLPQPSGMRRSVDGPRTDVTDVTQWVYYPIANAVPGLLRGHLAAVRDAAGNVTRFESYDAFGNATRVVDPNGVVTESTYDAAGRLLTTTLKAVSGCDTAVDPLCATDLATQRTYSPALGPLASETRPDGGTTAYEYDDRRRTTAMTRSVSATLYERAEYDYDPATGKRSAERFKTGSPNNWTLKRSETFLYDSLARLREIDHADGTKILYTYDGANNLVGVQDENHTTANTTYTYDPLNRLKSVRQTLGAGSITTNYAYDVQGNLASVTDPNGNVTTYAYDDFGRVASQNSPVTGMTTYTYDAAGSLTSTTDANGATTTRTYDALGRVTSSSPVRPPRDPEPPTTWSYDDTGSAPFGRGRLTSMTEPSGATVYRYDRRGLLASELKTIATQTFTTSLQYDAAGNRSLMRYPSGRTVTWTFDLAGRPITAATGSTTLVASASYLPFGPATAIVFGNGTTRQTSYDMRYRLQANVLSHSGSAVASYQYHYDNAGNITGIDDQIDPSFTRSFGYDDLNRLTAANTGEALWGAGSYAYDAMGNVLTLSLRRAASFFYAGTTPRLSSADGRDVVYDAAGNEQRVGTDGMAYTALNQLARWNDISYTYDGRGVRTITSWPVRIVGVSIAPSTVTGGASAQGTVTLSSPAPAAGAVVVLTSSDAAASVPASVTVAGGQTAATFAVSTVSITGAVNAVITATFNGSSASGTLTIAGSRIDSVQTTPQSVVGGTEATGNITLASPAPEEGISIALRSSDPAVSVPSEMSIRGGATGASFPISTTPVARATTATISVLLDEERHDAILTVVPPSIATLDFASRRVRGGSSVAGTIVLNGIAAEGGITVTLASGSRLLSVPSNAVVAAGERAATFTVQTTPVESDAVGSISATTSERSVTTDITIEPPVLTDFRVAPATVVGGDAVKATPVIDGPAAASGAAVTLSSSDPSLVAAPSAMTIPPGATSESVQLPTNAVGSATPVVISASRQGVTRSTTVTLEPPPITLQSLTIAPTSVVGTNDVQATVTLTGPAPAGGLEIELSSSDPTVAAVAPVVTVPEGASSANVLITTSLVTSDTQVTIAAQHATTRKTASLSVLHPSGNYISSIAITPLFIVGGSSAGAIVTLAMPSAEHGGSIVEVSSSNGAVAVPASVKVNANDTTATFSIATTTILSPVPVVITASYGGVVQRARVVVAPKNAVTLASFTIAPDRVPGGTAAIGTVTLSGPAPNGGASVTVEARRRNIVTVPNTVVVPEGATVTTFTIATDALHAAREKSAEIVTTYNNVSSLATLTVLPAVQGSRTRTPVALCASLASIPCVTQSSVRKVAPLGGRDGDPPPPTTITLLESRYTLYSPELTLLAETTTSAAPPSIAYEYIWFGGQPLAQVETTTGNVRWYFNDHLGTPLALTDENARLVWRAEYEPYGAIYAVHRGSSETTHQPLRLPGQTAEEGSDLYQNVFRWYRAGWGRYTQPDPLAPGGPGHFGGRRMLRFLPPGRAARERLMRENAEVSSPALLGITSAVRRPTPKGLSDATNPYAYAADSPAMYTDPQGLAPCLTFSINPISDYVPAGPPGKTFKGCQYIGHCYNAVVGYEVDVDLGCKCKQFCLMNIDPTTSAPIGPSICFNMPPWWTLFSPPLIHQ